ncbi:MAG TPA: helix-turn-helix domain-containing protein [Candidatus Nanoarchaeia archaeon]|nr:helix-turn-helix domain-containing protein [Candidatus Nanoarchaeia archaeon]
MKEQALHALGLNKKEVEVYLASLQIGSALVQDIAHAASINRTSAYDVLSSLEQQGFVSHTMASGKRHYQAANPQKLLDMVKEKENLVKKALPELASIAESVTQKPRVEVYVGRDGLKSVFEDILRDTKSFLCIASKKHLFKLFQYYFPHFVERRKKQRIKVRIISDQQPYDKRAPYKLMKGDIKTATWIYNGKIAMVSLEESEPIGILIQEKNFYTTQKMMFDRLWKSL